MGRDAGAREQSHMACARRQSASRGEDPTDEVTDAHHGEPGRVWGAGAVDDMVGMGSPRLASETGPDGPRLNLGGVLATTFDNLHASFDRSWAGFDIICPGSGYTWNNFESCSTKEFLQTLHATPKFRRPDDADTNPTALCGSIRRAAVATHVKRWPSAPP